MSLDSTSRYLLTDIIRIIDPITGRVRVPPYPDIRQRQLSVAADDRFLIVNKGLDSWGAIALTYLRDAKAWWVIADMSGVVDAFSDLDQAVADGIRLRIPSVQRYLFKVLQPERFST